MSRADIWVCVTRFFLAVQPFGYYVMQQMAVGTVEATKLGLLERLSAFRVLQSSTSLLSR